MDEKFFNLKTPTHSGSVEYFFNLIKERKINIIEFDLCELVQEYIYFLENNLDEEKVEDFASNIFLISYMIWIKTKIIIPKEEMIIPQEISELEENIKNLELKKKLIEYKKFKDISSYFQKVKEKSDKIFSKQNSFIKNTEENYSFNMELLTSTFKKIAKNHKNNNHQFSRIQKQELEPSSLEDLILDKLKNILSNKTILINLVESIFSSLEYLIAIFLAILNLAKKRFIHLFQENNDVFIEFIGKGE